MACWEVLWFCWLLGGCGVDNGVEVECFGLVLVPYSCYSCCWSTSIALDVSVLLLYWGSMVWRICCACADISGLLSSARSASICCSDVVDSVIELVESTEVFCVLSSMFVAIVPLSLN